MLKELEEKLRRGRLAFHIRRPRNGGSLNNLERKEKTGFAGKDRPATASNVLADLSAAAVCQ
jgi:hypothetical protein